MKIEHLLAYAALMLPQIVSTQWKGANNSVVQSGVFNSVYVSEIQTNLCSDQSLWYDRNRVWWLSGEQESKQNENQYEQQANKNSEKKNR